MADTKSTTDKVKDTVNEKVIDPMKRAGEAMKASGEKVAEGSSAVGLKVIDQAEQNAREAFAAMRAAASAKDLSEVMKIQGDYLREQGSRSMAQAKEIADLIVQFGKDSAAPFRRGD
ncbi:MAG: phasin family protein [Pseudomonadota bacterium]